MNFHRFLHRCGNLWEETKFNARHVKFGGSNGASEWWLADNAPGGWVRFQHVDELGDAKKASSYVMEMVDNGTGAKSILGVM